MGLGLGSSCSVGHVAVRVPRCDVRFSLLLGGLSQTSCLTQDVCGLLTTETARLRVRSRLAVAQVVLHDSHRLWPTWAQRELKVARHAVGAVVNRRRQPTAGLSYACLKPRIQPLDVAAHNAFV